MRFSTTLVLAGVAASSIPALAAPSYYEYELRDYDDLYARGDYGLELFGRSEAERIAQEWRHQNNPHAPSPPPSSHGSNEALLGGGSSAPPKKGLKAVGKKVLNALKFGKGKKGKRDYEAVLFARDVEELLQREYPELFSRVNARDDFQWWA